MEDLREHCSESTIAELDAALLVFHAPQDAIVGVDNARLIFEAARHPKSFVSLDGADHLLTRPADARYVANVLASWAERYMRAPNEGVPPGTVIVEGLQGLAQHVVAGHHPFNADEPENVGGGDTGPTPYDLLLAALGTCTSMTMRIVADREDIPLERARVTLSHHRVHAKDCVDCESKAGRVDVIERSITLFGDLDDAQRKRLEQIADRCPVHKTLRGEIQIKTEMKPSSG